MTRRLTKVSAVVLSAILSARDATRHMNCVDVSTSNCDARNFHSKTHDHVTMSVVKHRLVLLYSTPFRIRLAS